MRDWRTDRPEQGGSCLGLSSFDGSAVEDVIGLTGFAGFKAAEASILQRLN